MSMSPKDLITYSKVHSVFIPKQVSFFHATVHSTLLNNRWEDVYLSKANIKLIISNLGPQNSSKAV